MTAETIKSFLRRRPFEALRVKMSSGESFEIRHPEMAVLTKAELIILDLNFPAEGAVQWSGLTVMQWLRRFPELATVPVILVSGSDAAQHKEKALAEGAVAFFQKPVKYQELLSAVLQALPCRTGEA